MAFSCLFIRNLKRIISGPTLKPWQLSATEPCLLRSSSKSRDTLKYRSSVSVFRDFLLCLPSNYGHFSLLFLFLWTDQSSLKIRRSSEREGVREMKNKSEGDLLAGRGFSCHYLLIERCNLTTTQYYRSEIQSQHLQEVCLYFKRIAFSMESMRMCVWACIFTGTLLCAMLSNFYLLWECFCSAVITAFCVCLSVCVWVCGPHD